MKIFKKGFTLIEVAIFLAISGALVAGIIISTTSVVDKQRYNGAIRGFMDYMQTIYSDVSNPKNPLDGGGRSDKDFIYGKLLTFGEKDADGQIRAYTVVGGKNNIKGSVVRDALSLLKDVGADITKKNEDGKMEFYDSSVQDMIWDIDIQDLEGNPFKGSILIAHSPASGVIYTYVSDAVIEVQQGQKLSDKIDTLSTEDISFCLAPKQMILYGGNRYEVRLTKNSHDPSGVILYSLDDAEEDGNKCMKGNS